MKTTKLLTLGLLGLIAGCQHSSISSSGPIISNEAVDPDPALLARGNNWEPSVLVYANGDVVAGPTLFPYQPDNSRREWQQGVFEPFLFIGQSVAAPVMAFITPAWGDARYEGVDTPPTRTGVPPLPPTSVEMPDIVTIDPDAVVVPLDGDTILVIPKPQPVVTPQPTVTPQPAITPEPAAPRKPAVAPAPQPVVTPSTRPAVVVPPPAPRTAPPTPSTRPADINK